MGMKYNPLLLSGFQFDLSGAPYFNDPVATEAALPTPDTNGAVRLALDTDHLYAYDGTTSKWIDLGLNLSASFGSTPNATGVSNASVTAGNITKQYLQIQPADATHPGAVSTVVQDLAGNKTFKDDVIVEDSLLANTIDARSATSMSIGAVNATVINIGNAGVTVNVQGTTHYENVDQLQVKDPLITLNKGGGVGSAAASGIELEENAVITGYAKSSADRNSWELKAPNAAGVATVTPGAGGITLNQTSHDPLTLTAVGATPNANGASLSTQALTLQPADTTNPGVLTAADWNTFNNKQATVTVGALDAQAANAAGLAFVANVISTQSADATHPGVVNTGTQSFAGDKTVVGNLLATNLSGTNTGDQGISTLTDVSVTSLQVNDVLSYNGVAWTNGVPTIVSGGIGVNFYNSSPTINATGTQNALQLNTLTNLPVTTAEQTIVGALATNTVAMAAWVASTALGLTSIAAGVWNFLSFAGVNRTDGGRVTTITRQVYSVLPTAAGTVTMTGAGTSRTATASAGTPFAVAAINASATNTTASFLQTPQGMYQITARTSDTVVTIAVPTTYTNEATVTYSVWKKLFGATSTAITSISPVYSQNSWISAQPAFTITALHKIGTIAFGTSNNTTTLTLPYDGTTHNSFVQTPMLVLHNDIGGLQGGSANEDYHLTALEYTRLQTLSNNVVLASFLGANNQAAAANVTGLAFANGSIRAFDALVSVTVDATADLFEVFKISGIQRGADWIMASSSEGDVSGVIFSITTGGQVQYQSTDNAGFVSLTMKYSAEVTTV